MIEQFFKCTLLSDVVLNSQLATECNMTTLDYIPGSNFMGIVAGKLYKDLDPLDAYAIFHSGEVSYGNATISVKNEVSYPVPFNFMMVKGKERLGENQVYLQHLLNEYNHPKNDEFKEQLKQKRSGYITSSGEVINKIEKTFALKSAQDAEQRRSKEGAMFGFESLKKGQEFIFSVRFKEEKYIHQISEALLRQKRVGKSKTAQYGEVEIEPLELEPTRIKTYSNDSYSLVYLQSNLCVFDEFGQPTFQPKATDLGLKGEIDWRNSSIRTHSYSPWNGKRNTTDTQRNCIAGGSVFFIRSKNEAEEKSVGAFQSEGLGRIIINPKFLKGNEDTAKSTFKLTVVEAKKDSRPFPGDPQTALGKLLKIRYDQKITELELSRAIQEAFSLTISKEKDGKFIRPELEFRKVTSSQWGAIRNYASKAKNLNDLRNNILDGENAYLKHGVAYDRIWSKGKNLSNLEKVFERAEESSNAITFITKFASQMAKQATKNLKK